MQKKKKFYSLEIVRCFAFICVFVSHTSIPYFKKLGGLAVSVFFILNGFLMMHNYYKKERINAISFKVNFRFMLKKIKMLYPLHIITTVALFVPYFFIYPDLRTRLFGELFSNALLLQAWIPVKSYLNYTSWFLGCLAFDFFLFPIVLRRMEEKQTNYSISLLLLFILQIIFGFVGTRAVGLIGVNPNVIGAMDISHWFIYNSPVSRFIDFLIGVNLYLLFINKDHFGHNNGFLEILTIVAAFLCAFIDTKAIGTTWWSDVVIFTPISCVLIYLFAVEEGFISKTRNRIVMYIADISKEGFLIHSVVFTYIESIISRILYSSHLEKDAIVMITDFSKLTIGFLITLFCVWLWRNFKKRIGNE